MYIRSYQIHNVLNVYRKQLSHGPVGKGSSQASGDDKTDRISISADSQRQSIMDKISTDIVEQISKSGPQSQFESVLAGKLSKNPPQQNSGPVDNQQDFKYTRIDENNRKTTNTLTVRGFGPNVNGSAAKVYENMGKNPAREMD